MTHIARQLVFFLVLLLLAGAALAQSASVIDSDTAVRCLREVAWEFGKQAEEEGKQAPGIKITGGGSRKGIEALCNGQADIAVLGVPLTGSMKKSLSKAFPDGTAQPTEVVFSQTALMLVVHKDNPRKSLSVEQLRQVFSGEVTNPLAPLSHPLNGARKRPTPKANS
jgi:ABC-type phosphate transport system substrate-binding protein